MAGGISSKVCAGAEVRTVLHIGYLALVEQLHKLMRLLVELRWQYARGWLRHSALKLNVHNIAQQRQAHALLATSSATTTASQACQRHLHEFQ